MLNFYYPNRPAKTPSVVHCATFDRYKYWRLQSNILHFMCNIYILLHHNISIIYIVCYYGYKYMAVVLILYKVHLKWSTFRAAPFDHRTFRKEASIQQY